MADDKKATRAESSGVASWVDAYWTDNNEGLSAGGTDLTSKPEKFRHLQSLSTFSTIAYYVNNNSPTAHIDFFATNYTHMSNAVEKATRVILLLLEKKFSSADPANFFFSSNELKDACNQVGLDLTNPATHAIDLNVIEDYRSLVESCSHFIPVFQDNTRTRDNLHAINNDGELVAHHGELVGQFGGDNKCSLDLKNIRLLNRRTIEKSSETWEDVEASKSTNLKDRAKHEKDLFYTRNELIMKTGKVGALAAGGIYCVGSIAAGFFLPALGLIPLYHLAKRWLPQFFESFGKSWATRMQLFKDKREKKLIEAEEYYLKHKGEVRLEDQIAGRLPKYRREQLDKQLKTMSLFYGQDNLGNATAKGISNAGALDNPKEVDNQVPADILGRWKGYSANFEGLVKRYKENTPDADGKLVSRKEVFDQMKKFANDLMKFDDKVPSDKQKDEVYNQFYNQMMNFFYDMVFEKGYNGNVKKDFEDFIKNEDINKLIYEKQKERDLGIRFDNVKTFIAQEKKPTNTVHDCSFSTLGGVSDVSMGALMFGIENTTDNIEYIKNACSKIPCRPGVQQISDTQIGNIVSSIFDPSCDQNYETIKSVIDGIDDDHKDTRKYLEYVLKIKRNTTLLNKTQLDSEGCFLNANGPIQINGIDLTELISKLEIKVPTTEKDIKEYGKIIARHNNGNGNIEISLKEIKSKIKEITDDNNRQKASELLNQQLQRLNTFEQMRTRKKSTDAIKDEFLTGGWGLYGSNFKRKESDEYAIDNKLTYDKTEDADQIFDNIVEYIPSCGKLDYLFFKLSDKMNTIFKKKLQTFETGIPTVEDLTKFLKKVNTARYLNEGQKENLISGASKFIYQAVNKSYDDMREDFMNLYKYELFQNLTKSYENGGFGEFFDSEPTSKQLFETITLLKETPTLIKQLSFDDTKIDPEELKFISQVYFNENKDKTKAPPIRDAGDILSQFINKISNINSSFASVNYTDEDYFKSDPVIINIQNIKDELTNWNPQDEDADGKRDKYAACLILKDKCVQLFRAYVQGYIARISQGKPNAIEALNGGDAIDNFNQYVIGFWKKVFGGGGGIDALLNGCASSLGYAGNAFKGFEKELGRYTNPQKIVSSSSEREL